MDADLNTCGAQLTLEDSVSSGSDSDMSSWVPPLVNSWGMGLVSAEARFDISNCKGLGLQLRAWHLVLSLAAEGFLGSRVLVGFRVV